MKGSCSLWVPIIGIGIGVAIAIAVGFFGMARPIATAIPITTFLAFCLDFQSRIPNGHRGAAQGDNLRDRIFRQILPPALVMYVIHHGQTHEENPALP
jgi:hypothetical protein